MDKKAPQIQYINHNVIIVTSDDRYNFNLVDC